MGQIRQMAILGALPVWLASSANAHASEEAHGHGLHGFAIFLPLVLLILSLFLVAKVRAS